MNKALRRMPSPSIVISIVALLVAASGTAVAASTLSGDSLIAKRSLSGNRLRNHTITGTQVNLGKLGKVPSAKNADHATTAVLATTAGSATTATNAANAGNANALAGQPASAYDSSSNFARTGVVGTNEGQSVTLATFPPFTLTLSCIKTGGGQPDARVFATSSQANSEAGGQALPTAGVQSTNPIVDSGSGATFTESGGMLIDFAMPGSAWMGDINAAVNYAGDVHQCVAWAVIDKS
jgi:hypothetical protein